MSEKLADLLRRSADAAPAPRLDVAFLVAEAGRRQRHQRMAVAATAAVVVGIVAAGSFAVRGGSDGNPEPAPADPTETHGTVDAHMGETRPLVYATGSTVHVGDDSFEADADVTFLDATDDGVVFMTNASDSEWFSDTLWFNDGTTTEAIGRAPTPHIGYPFNVDTANPGSLVVWADATSRTKQWVDQFVVYDTSRHQVVGHIPYTGVDEGGETVLHVDENAVYFNPGNGTPGCWTYDIHRCDDPHLLRYDMASGETRKVTQASFETELGTRHRMLVLTDPGDSEYVTSTGAQLEQVGRRLVPDDPTVISRTTGEPVELRVPAGYTAPGPADESRIRVVQWLDDDHLVLFADKNESEIPQQVGDLLECRLPDGACHVAVPASSTPYEVPD